MWGVLDPQGARADVAGTRTRIRFLSEGGGSCRFTMSVLMRPLPPFQNQLVGLSTI